MAYSRWATKDELMSILTQVNYDSEIKKSGIPMMYDDNNLYIKNDEPHTMVIGATGSGKTQVAMLPLLRLAIKANESFIIHDVKGEIYNVLSGELKAQNYNTVVINLDNPTLGNNFNPLSLPYELYRKGEKDRAIELLENIGFYFCCSEKIEVNVDPFWTNSATSLFVGLALYLFENAEEEEINISSLCSLVADFDKLADEIKKYDRNSALYINLSTILLAPTDTRGGIISVFVQNMRLFASRESLLKLLSTTNFDIESIQKEKTAIFIISNSKAVSRRLIPLIVDECYFATTLNNNASRRLNIVLDEFENLVPIKDFNNVLALSRSYNIRFSIYIKSLLELRNIYGTEGTEILKMEFGNIIYLMTNDIETLQDISKLCGNKQSIGGTEPLISVEELKLLKIFEAVIIMPRIYPVKTKLLPDFKIDWKFNEEKVPMQEIENKNIKTYQLK